MKLKLASGGIAQNQDFRYSDRALFIAWAADNRGVIDSMQPNDCVLFISKTRKRGMLVCGNAAQMSISAILDGKFAALHFHCPRGFSWLMLGEYAAELGIQINGVRRLDEVLRIVADHVTSKPLRSMAELKRDRDAIEAFPKLRAI